MIKGKMKVFIEEEHPEGHLEETEQWMEKLYESIDYVDQIEMVDPFGSDWLKKPGHFSKRLSERIAAYRVAVKLFLWHWSGEYNTIVWGFRLLCGPPACF